MIKFNFRLKLNIMIIYRLNCWPINCIISKRKTTRIYQLEAYEQNTNNNFELELIMIKNLVMGSVSQRSWSTMPLGSRKPGANVVWPTITSRSTDRPLVIVVRLWKSIPITSPQRLVWDSATCWRIVLLRRWRHFALPCGLILAWKKFVPRSFNYSEL